MWDMAHSVLIFLGISLVAGALTRFTLMHRRGKDWYDNDFAPRLGPSTLIGLLFTIVVMFSMQGEKILANPLDVLRVSLPLLVYL